MDMFNNVKETILMLDNYKTLKKGEICTIDGESDTKKSWKVQERVNVRKSEMNKTFRFVTNLAPDEIDRLTSEVKKQGESTSNAVERKIQMYKNYKTLKKAGIYRVVEKTDPMQVDYI
eukprot:TRINITY_DN32916_c0_g1_i1.p1 TRINITY_DN32916_c0_g1~~TRINITY_DN32916_c0_g1_i1.p1  ORF type:complete len:118 (-),score=27.99 TRINITY_DN32916_c0_g1_i1:102-455(-)